MIPFFQRNKASYILSGALSFRSTGYLVIQRHVCPIIVRAGIFLLHTASGLVRGASGYQANDHCKPFSRGSVVVNAMGKLPHSLLSAEVKNVWSYTANPHMPSYHKHRDATLLHTHTH
jgi:hypothetical protein